MRTEKTAVRKGKDETTNKTSSEHPGCCTSCCWCPCVACCCCAPLAVKCHGCWQMCVGCCSCWDACCPAAAGATHGDNAMSNWDPAVANAAIAAAEEDGAMATSNTGGGYTPSGCSLCWADLCCCFCKMTRAYQSTKTAKKHGAKTTVVQGDDTMYTVQCNMDKGTLELTLLLDEFGTEQAEKIYEYVYGRYCEQASEALVKMHKLQHANHDNALGMLEKDRAAWFFEQFGVPLDVHRGGYFWSEFLREPGDLRPTGPIQNQGNKLTVPEPYEDEVKQAQVQPGYDKSSPKPQAPVSKAPKVDEDAAYVPKAAPVQASGQCSIM